jgi:hypothetical protein
VAGDLSADLFQLLGFNVELFAIVADAIDQTLRISGADTVLTGKIIYLIFFATRHAITIGAATLRVIICHAQSPSPAESPTAASVPNFSKHLSTFGQTRAFTLLTAIIP